MSEHAVLVEFNYGLDDLDPMYELEDALESLIDETGVGEFDGHEIAVDMSDGRFYMYGPDADALFAAIEPTLMNASFMAGAKVTKRYGPPEDGVPETVVTIGA